MQNRDLSRLRIRYQEERKKEESLLLGKSEYNGPAEPVRLYNPKIFDNKISLFDNKSHLF